MGVYMDSFVKATGTGKANDPICFEEHAKKVCDYNSFYNGMCLQSIC